MRSNYHFSVAQPIYEIHQFGTFKSERPKKEYKSLCCKLKEEVLEAKFKFEYPQPLFSTKTGHTIFIIYKIDQYANRKVVRQLQAKERKATKELKNFLQKDMNTFI